MTLTDFLLQRIAEDEEIAKAAEWGPRWIMASDLPNAMPGIVPHIARHSPARVLADCEAKRRIVEDHKPIIVWPEGTGGAKFYTGRKWVCASCADGPTSEVPCRTLKFLALSYASHPSYREEWRP